MIRDFLLYSRFKIRLIKGAVFRSISGIVASDLREEKGLGDRLYQLYGLAIALLWLSLMWFFLLDFTGELFVGGGIAFTQSITQFSLLVPPVLFIFLAFNTHGRLPGRCHILTYRLLLRVP